MKYVVILGDGMADYPVDAFDGKTILEVADKPTIDYMAKHGEMGMVKTVQDGMKPGSDVANLSVMGYDTKKCYSGRSPLEAASIGVPLKDNDVTFRCNLVTRIRQCLITVQAKSQQKRLPSLSRLLQKSLILI